MASLTSAVLQQATPACTTAIPDNNGYVPPDSCNANYGFYPRWGDNAAFAITFGLTTVTHLAQAIALRKPFCWVIIMGALWECACFVLRTLGAKDQQNSTYVTLSTLLFLLAPLWINAFVYMTVARLVYFVEPSHRVARIPATLLAKVFVAADIVSFVIQAAGGALLANDDSGLADIGRKIYMAGVSAQLVFVLIFFIVVVIFYRELRETQNRWTRPLLWTLCIVLVLIVERIIFRLVEFSHGASSSNVVLRHEAFQLYLDALPMLLAFSLLNLVHPGLVLRGSKSSIPSSGIKWWKGRSAAFEPLALQPLYSGQSMR